MKTSTFLLNSKYLLNKAAIIVLAICISANAFAGGGGKLDFKNSSLESGVAGADGAVYRFARVDGDLDALVTIKGRSDALVYLLTIDMVTSGFDKAWQPQVGYNSGTAPGPADWWMEFEISFVKKGTSTPQDVDEFDLSAIDIDGNGHLIGEYVAFYGLTSYILESNSVLGITNLIDAVNGVNTAVGTKFNGPTVNYLNIDTSGTSVMTTVKYQETQKFSVRTGGVSTGVSGASERMYSLYFQEFRYNQPTLSILPVTLESFNAKLISSKVTLDWVCAEQTNLSHFIVQRSTDGKTFNDASMIFSNEADKSYAYTDNIAQNASGLIYYRLKIVEEKGSYKYSAIRIVKLDRNAQVTVSAYPNPVLNELRITIPAHWQNKHVVYDIFNVNGTMVKRWISEHASQTETMQVNDMNAGMYVIKLRSGNESAVQQIVKK